MKDECLTCGEPCDFLTEYVKADRICPCCRSLLASLHPENAIVSFTGAGTWLSSASRDQEDG